MQKIVTKTCYYEATELFDIMKDVHKSMRERHCFRRCFRRSLLYLAIYFNRSDLVALLLADKRAFQRTSTVPCTYLPQSVLWAFETGNVEQLLSVESPLSAGLVDQLRGIVEEDILDAAEYAYINNNLDMFRSL